MCRLPVSLPCCYTWVKFPLCDDAGGSATIWSPGQLVVKLPLTHTGSTVVLPGQLVSLGHSNSVKLYVNSHLMEDNKSDYKEEESFYK